MPESIVVFLFSSPFVFEVYRVKTIKNYRERQRKSRKKHTQAAFVCKVKERQCQSVAQALLFYEIGRFMGETGALFL